MTDNQILGGNAMPQPWLALLLLAMTIGWPGSAGAYYLDSPHNESNGIYCYTCHSLPYWWAYNSTGPDDTVRNAVCLRCHGEGSTHPRKGPPMFLHSSSNYTTTYGDWSTECTQCHDAHAQGQLDWAGLDDDRLFLAQGLFSHGVAPLAFNPDDPAGGGFGATSVGFASLSGQSGWLDPATWLDKGGRVDPAAASDQSRGLVLVPNKANPSETFEIVGVAGNTIKVKGRMTAAPNGQAFGVIYGQAIRSFVLPSWGQGVADYRDVKYFNPTASTPETYGGLVDQSPNASQPLGLCQVCHARTAYWRKDSSGYNPTSHNGHSDCLACHSPLMGGTEPQHADFIGDRTASGCGNCHPGYLSAPDTAHLNGCQTCHTAVLPGINNNLMNSELITVQDSLLNGGYLFTPRLVDSNYRDIGARWHIGSPGFQVIACLECHETKNLDHVPLVPFTRPLARFGSGSRDGGSKGLTK